jgi:hypothetical protein
MACLRYYPATRTFYPIKRSQMAKQATGEGVSFKDQVMRGYARQEARGAAIHGRKAGIQKIWANN